ncbi:MULTISPECIES: hypothetical protein [unclassified Streptomyces]|uniref:Secreted protein n=1 Tax=Streptomyces sp. NBC_00060 TaxID=2975636 RepID=A0AAU2HAK4_9ACTN
MPGGPPHGPIQRPDGEDGQPRSRRIRPWLTHTAAAAVGLLIGALAGSVGHSSSDGGASPTVTATRTETAALPPTAAPPRSEDAGHAKAGQIPGDGISLIGRDIRPGTYHSEGPQGDPITYYTWARLNKTSGEGKDVISADASKGAETVTIAATDKAFRTNGCKTWKKTN